MRDDVRVLLASPNLEASDAARLDLESGLVDRRLVALLASLATRHRLRVSTIKTGHPLGPRSPGGRENDHFFYRAADITDVDGLAIQDDPASDALVELGRSLMALRGPARPARVMGPAAWHAALGEGDRSGFRNDEFAASIHSDHLHIGFQAGPAAGRGRRAPARRPHTPR